MTRIGTAPVLCALVGLLSVAWGLPAGSPPALAEGGEPHVTEGNVEQGDSGDREFESPMIIEMPLESAAPSEDGQWISSSSFRSYVCEDVRLSLIETRVTRKKAQVRCDVRVTLYTEPGDDKEVTLKLELVRGGEVIGTGRISEIDAEEKKKGSGSGNIRVPLDDWPDGEDLMLRITMSVIES